MKNWKSFAVSAALIITPVLAGCSATQTPTEHYVSPKIQGEAKRINLEEVQKAFWESKGKDFNSWMAAFEKRVNEIYDGKEVVSIDASRSTGHLVVTGYINKVDKEGFQPGDEKLFAIEQTGEAVNNELPYRVSTGDGRPYYEGHRSLLDNPFVQMMAASAISSAVMGHFNRGGGGGWGGHYYTPQPQVVILQQSRDQFRTSPTYQQQQASNNGFFSRFKTNQTSGALESRSKFGGQQPFSSSASTAATDAGSKKRSWFGGSKSASQASPSSSPTSSPFSSSTAPSSSSGWGGRRSSAGSGFSSGFSGRRSGFGGRRR